jgi:hypothetical protein
MDAHDLRELYKVFQAQGVEVVYAVRCCGRVYLGRDPAVKCRTCAKLPKNIEIRAEADLDGV